MEFTKELISQAKACKTAEELLALAKENEIELTYEEAEALLEEFREGEVSDEELDNVAGGAEGCGKRNAYEEVIFSSEEAVRYIFNIGDIRQEFIASVGHHTMTVKITNRRAREFRQGDWIDEYDTEKLSRHIIGSPGWSDRTMFEIQ